MNSNQCACLDAIFQGSGVARYAVAEITQVDPEGQHLYSRWISEGKHGSMLYLDNYQDIRCDPTLLLPGARSIVCCAIPFPSPCREPQKGAEIASYALGTDYHIVVRDLLEKTAESLRERFGGQTRVCVDTAPLRERYWAARSGLGFIGLNNHVIIPGLGSCFFLGEILTTAVLEPTPGVLPEQCSLCGRCVRACPSGALDGKGGCNAARCLSYLTIEYRGDFPEGTDLKGHLYGCDVCAAVCPFNIEAAHAPVIPQLQPREEVVSLTAAKAATLTQSEFSTIFARSAVKRTKLAGLRRNAIQILSPENQESYQKK